MKPVVYRIEFPDGNFYIGSTVNFQSRRVSHLRAFRGKATSSSKLTGAFHANRVCGIYVIASGFSRESLHLLEADLIAQERPTLNTNTSPTPLAPPGCGGSKPFGPYPSLKDAAVALNMPYGSLKLLAKHNSYDQLVAYLGVRRTKQEGKFVGPPDPRENCTLVYAFGSWSRRADVYKATGVSSGTAMHRRRKGASFEQSVRPLQSPMGPALKTRVCRRYNVGVPVFDRRRSNGMNTLQALGLTPRPENCMRRPKVRERILEAGGLKLTVKQWAARMGVSPGVLHARLSAGWSVEQVVGLEKRPVQIRREETLAEIARVAAIKAEKKAARLAQEQVHRARVAARKVAQEREVARRREQYQGWSPLPT